MTGLVCRRCREPVGAGRGQYDMFEEMHWVCFHYAFEHGIDGDVDVDADCGIVGCPSAPAAIHRDRLVAVLKELADDWVAGAPADWGTTDLGEFLEAVAVRLEELDDVEPPDGGRRPWSSWAQVGEALRRAAAG